MTPCDQLDAMKKISFLIIIAVFCFSSAKAQNTFDIIFTQNADKDSRCTYFKSYFNSTPKEIGYSIKREGNKLYFQVTDKAWAIQLFKKAGDGLAIDVVSKSRYKCDTILKDAQILGTILKPVYAKQLIRGFKPSLGSRFKSFVGTVPENLKEEELEFNILFLNNKVLCRYQSLYNLESYPWELLDMGVYLDSLMYKDKKIRSSDSFITKYKTLKFSIPFEKNKAEYSSEDIKPLYDSLRLTDFNIKKIQIKAYASIEGSLKRNLP